MCRSAQYDTTCVVSKWNCFQSVMNLKSSGEFHELLLYELHELLSYECKIKDSSHMKFRKEFGS